ncbi:MAG: TldD/PmbA family protein [Candidatus Bilamarchaeaceae archaeon]
MSKSAAHLEKEIFFMQEESISLLYSAKSLKVREQSEQVGYGVRVYAGSGLGFSFTNEEKNLKKAIETAVRTSKYSKRENFYFPQKSNFKKIELSDKKIKEIDAIELKDILQQIKEGAEKYGGNAQIFLDKTISFERLENDNGFFGEYESTALSVNIEVMDEDGYGFFSNSFGKLNDVRDFFELGGEAAEMARKMKHPKKPESGLHLVVFEPEAVASLIDILLPSFNGDLKRRKISFLHDKEKKKIFSEKLSLYNDPLIPYSPLSSPFDGEGVISQKSALIKEGVVENFAYNIETASLEGINKCGFAVRSSYSAPPNIGFSNLVIEKGDLEEYIHPSISVFSFHGTHTANTTTGDFGLEVNVAFENINGEQQPLRGFMITGNIFNLFRDIYGIGTIVKNIGGVFTPRIAFADVQIVSS